MAYNNYMNPYGYSNMYSNPQMPVNNLQMPMSNMVQQPVIKGRYASSLDYENAQNTCAITNNATANIINAVRPFPTPSYQVSSPYGTSYPNCGCGC